MQWTTHPGVAVTADVDNVHMKVIWINNKGTNQVPHFLRAHAPILTKARLIVHKHPQIPLLHTILRLYGLRSVGSDLFKHGQVIWSEVSE